MASILLSVISFRAFSIRALRSSSVIVGTAGVIGFNAAIAAGVLEAVLLAAGCDAAGAGAAHEVKPAPNPAAAPDCRNVRRVDVINCPL
jgi:hypothetical protein